MGVIKQQSIKGTAYSYFGVILGFINVILLFPRILDPEQIGLVNLIIAISTIFAQFGSLGFNNVTTRLFSYFRDKENKHHGFLFIAIMVALVGSLLVCIVFYFLEDTIIQQNASKSNLLSGYINYHYPLIFFTIYYTIFDNYCKVLFNSTLGTFYKEVVFRLFTLGNLLFLYFHIYNFDVFMLIYIATLCYPTFALTVYLIRQGEFSLKPKLSFIDNTLTKQIVGVAFFGILSGVGGIAISNVDKYIVSSFLNLSFAGIYSISFFFGTLILMPARAVIKISSAVLAEAWKKKNIITISEVYQKSCLTQYIIAVLLFIGIWGNIDNIFKILPSEYAGGRYVILFVSLANVIEMLSGTSGMIIQTSRYYPFLTYARAGSIVVLIVSNILLIPIWGITGAAIAVLLTRLSITVTKFLYILFRFKLQPYTKQIVHITILGFLAYIPAYLLPELDSLIVDLAIRSALMSIVYLLGLLILKPSDELQGVITSIWKLILGLFKKSDRD